MTTGREVPRIDSGMAHDLVTSADIPVEGEKLETDKLGTLAMTLEGCKERDRFVLQTCHDANIPVQCSMGGGYSPEIRIIVEAHANTFRLAQDIYG